ncbi:hypothetical protein [Eubacterium sp. F2]|jgi:hypothetical protein|uniref:hypothetical protein n=1 Tax=Eubacterium sp. F2 TaxID=3381348 RepID=UPI0039080ED0
MSRAMKYGVYNIIYITIVAIIGIIVRHFYSIHIPDNVSLGIGAILCVAGIIVLLIESKDTKGSYFYSHADNWNGGGILNSGLILGISVFFIAVTVKTAILYILAICVVNMIIRMLGDKTNAQSHTE